MKTNRCSYLIVFIAASLPALQAANASPRSDQPAALITFPYVTVDSARGIDTIVQISNSSTTSPVNVFCRWLDSSSFCTNDRFDVCRTDGECIPPGVCQRNFSITDFVFTLTIAQPLVFSASNGLTRLPCDPLSPSPSCNGSAKGAVRGVPEEPFVGALQCFTVDPSTVDSLTVKATEQNVLRGEATIEHYQAPGLLDAARYNAIGLAAIPGANNGDDQLILGGEAAEYQACPYANSLTHFFENAVEPVNGTSHIFTRLILTPCSYDPLSTDTPGHATVDYLVFNEFEQRLSVRKEFSAIQFGRFSDINPLAWDVGLQGTLSGQTRFANTTDNNGVIAVAVEEQEAIADPSQIATAAMGVYTQGDRVAADVIGAGGTCGNGLVEPGEACDDGNLVSGDGCDSGCHTESCYVCEGSPSVCGPPTLCDSAGESSLVIDDNPTKNTKDKFVWELSDAGFNAQIDNPIVATDYILCVYDGSQIAMRATIEHGGTCGSKPCWKALGTRGFVYKNPSGNGDGFIAATLKRNADESVQISMTGKGTNLALPGPISATQYFTQSPNVTVALFKSTSGECWQSDFFTNTKNTSDQFTASIP